MEPHLYLGEIALLPVQSEVFLVVKVEFVTS